MCGICGMVYIFDIKKKVEYQIIKKMCGTLVHRGPDDEGIFIDNNVGLGIRRLSIIDLATGHQPLFNEDKSICVIVNGEIYNFRELKRILEGRGHSFYTNSDAEVIVHLYEEDETNFIEQLNGMFAFAIWDRNKNKLVIVRDRLGVKPLYYTTVNGKLIFASEIKALLSVGIVERKVNLEALDYYLSLNYIPSPLTMFEGINKLPSASMLTIEKAAVKLSKYWDVKYSSDVPQRTEGYYSEGVLSLLKDAVKRRLESDVPLGFFLSGGIDSSTIVALASSFAIPIKTFSIAFHEKSFDESRSAKSVAKQFNTDHHEFIVSPQIQDVLPKVVWHMDEPCADSSVIPVYYLAGMARTKVTVALSGDGGDELFAGYHTYNAYKLAKIYKKLPRFLKDSLSRVIKRLPISYSKVSFEYMAKRFIDGSHLDPLRAHLWWRGIFSEDEKNCLYTKNTVDYLNQTNRFGIFGGYENENSDVEELSRLLYFDLKVYLSDDILLKVDRMSMANSLEVRSPFLDFKLVEFVAKIPVQLKLRGFMQKYILKKAVSGILSPQTIYRRKQGFSIPVALWIKTALKEMTLDLLAENRINEQGLFNPEYINRLLKLHFEGKMDNGYRIWGLLVFSLWYDTFVKGNV